MFHPKLITGALYTRAYSFSRPNMKFCKSEYAKKFAILLNSYEIATTFRPPMQDVPSILQFWTIYSCKIEIRNFCKFRQLLRFRHIALFARPAIVAFLHENCRKGLHIVEGCVIVFPSQKHMFSSERHEKAGFYMNIALLGCGVVGGGVLEIAEKRADMSVRYVLVRRDKPELGEKAVKDINVILNDDGWTRSLR